MKIFLVIFIILISSCSSKPISSNISDDDFSMETNIDNFIKKLEIYSKNKPFPNIDN